MAKKINFHRAQKGRIRGLALHQRVSAIEGCAIQSLECGLITKEQLESARLSIKRLISTSKKRISVPSRIQTTHILTKKPPETRMGKGKGTKIRAHVAKVKKGKFIFEFDFGRYDPKLLKALRRAQLRLPLKTRIVRRHLTEII
jgi:large subunit ribosomal protein L16